MDSEIVEKVARAKQKAQDARDILNSAIEGMVDVHAELAAMTEGAGELVEPIPMLLFCPKCGLQHVDEPDERTPDWTNPPHRSHLCHGCGCIWRPADVPTNGVAAIETRGKADTWAAGDAALSPETVEELPK